MTGNHHYQKAFTTELINMWFQWVFQKSLQLNIFLELSEVSGWGWDNKQTDWSLIYSHEGGEGYCNAVDTYTHHVGDQQALFLHPHNWQAKPVPLSPYFPKEKLRPKEVKKLYQSPDLLEVAELGFNLISGSRNLWSTSHNHRPNYAVL